MKNSSKGFTLVELLVVITIIVMLMAISLSWVGQSREKALDAKRIAGIKQLKTAVDNYFAVCYRFPQTLDDLKGDSTCPAYKPVFSSNSFPVDEDGSDFVYYSNVADVNAPQFYHVCGVLSRPAQNTGKTGLAPLDAADPCDGTDQYVFDLAGGVY